MSAFTGAMMGLQFGSQLGAAQGNYEMTKLQNEMRTESAKDAMNLDREILIRRRKEETRQRQKETHDSKQAAIDDSFTRSLQTMLARMQGLTPPAQPNLLAIASQSFAPAIDSNMADSFDNWFEGLFK